MNVYWAAPLFTAAERRFNDACAALLRGRGHRPHLPQDEPPSPDPAAVYEECVRALRRSDVVVACLDGPDPDSGTSWEVQPHADPVPGRLRDGRLGRRPGGPVRRPGRRRREGGAMLVRFDEVVLRVRRSGVCVRCGRRARRTYKLWQTVSPFNHDARGLPKTVDEIMAELRTDAKKVEERALMCAGCEHRLVDEICEAAPDLHDALGDDGPRAAEALSRLSKEKGSDERR